MQRVILVFFQAAKSGTVMPSGLIFNEKWRANIRDDVSWGTSKNTLKSTIPKTNILVAFENRPSPKREGSSPNHQFSGANCWFLSLTLGAPLKMSFCMPDIYMWRTWWRFKNSKTNHGWKNSSANHLKCIHRTLQIVGSTPIQFPGGSPNFLWAISIGSTSPNPATVKYDGL